MEYLKGVAKSNYFLEALQLFHEYQWLYNGPVTEILSNGSLDCLPEEWSKALEALDNDEFNDFVVKKITKQHWPETLKTFVQKCVNLTQLPIVDVLPLVNSTIELPANFAIGLSYKKQHEILQLARLVHEQCTPLGINVIVDLGAGLGYVCQIIHYLYGYQVLGLDRSQQYVDKARERQQKFYPNSLTHVKYAQCDLRSDSAVDIETVLQAEFHTVTELCVIGLHACGDLSVCASELFLQMKFAKVFIILSCCYHKLSISKNEEVMESHKKQYFSNFPVSSCFKRIIDTYTFDVGTFLRQPFLRLACQEPADRWHSMSIMDHHRHSFHVLARAVFQLYANTSGFLLKKKFQKATRKSQCDSFESYIKDSLSRYTLEPINRNSMAKSEHLDNTWHESKITELWQKYCQKLKTTEIYTALQLMLQAPAESLLLQDRLCWMEEQGVEAFISAVTNRNLSPRSYAIISQKKNFVNKAA